MLNPKNLQGSHSNVGRVRITSNKSSRKSTALVTARQYIWGDGEQEGGGRAPAPAFKRLTLSPTKGKGGRGAGPRVGRSLVKHWPPRISRHCLVSTSTRAPVSTADAYLGSRSEPTQKAVGCPKGRDGDVWVQGGVRATWGPRS